MPEPIPFRVVESARPADETPRQISTGFRARLDAGAKLMALGTAKARPRTLLTTYAPRARVDVEALDTTYYLSGMRQNEDIRFFVAYVVLGASPRRIHPRIFYKDVSLVWRSASHFVRSEGENWIGKGDMRTSVVDGEEIESSAEETTDLPLEIQTALELLCRETKKVPRDVRAVERVLRRGHDDRIEPYRDFTGPRRRAASDPRNLVHGGRSVARFTRRGDPTSMRFVRGFEPDFEKGVIEMSESSSRLYGGRLRRYRIISKNQKAQYLFFAGPRQVWIGTCQATSTEIMSYGVRTLDVLVDDDLLLPGYEYHFVDESEDPPFLYSQIPEGFVGPASTEDPSRSDASPWIDQMPVIADFRRQVLGQGRNSR